MTKDNFNLEWENHNQLIANTFKRLYEDETLTDVTIYCKDGPLRAHKLVISICSPYFNRIYQINPGVHMIVMVNGVTMKEMQLLLEFMYKGAVIIPAENYERVAEIADLLEMTNFRKSAESEDKKKFFHSLNMGKTLNQEKKQQKQKTDGNKIVADGPDNSIKVPKNEILCKEEVPEQDTQPDENESEESPEEEIPTSNNISCKTCNESFRNRKDLTVHVKTHSTSGKKPYACDFCSASFKRSSHLTRHRLIHTGEKPYSCPRCDKSFSRLDKLKQHTRNTHHSNSLVLTVNDLKKKRDLVSIEESSSSSNSSRKRHKGRPKKFPENEEDTDKKQPDYDITNLPYGDLNYLTMPEETNPMEPLVEIETSEVADGVKLKSTPAIEIKAVGGLRKIGECIVSVMDSS